MESSSCGCTCSGDVDGAAAGFVAVADFVELVVVVASVVIGQVGAGDDCALQPMYELG